MDEAFLTTGEVLEYLQVNLRTIYRLINAGKIPAVRVGRQWRFRKSDLDSWLQSQRLPTPPAAGAAATVRRRAAPASDRRPRVLVADDEPGIRELLTKVLALAEYEVDTVADGHSAGARLKASSFDLLITDLKMPGMDGLSLIREARSTAPDLPVIIMTAFSTEATAIEAINLGVVGYLTKPFRIAKILNTVAKALGE